MTKPSSVHAVTSLTDLAASPRHVPETILNDALPQAGCTASTSGGIVSCVSAGNAFPTFATFCPNLADVDWTHNAVRRRGRSINGNTPWNPPELEVHRCHQFSAGRWRFNVECLVDAGLHFRVGSTSQFLTSSSTALPHCPPHQHFDGAPNSSGQVESRVRRSSKLCGQPRLQLTDGFMLLAMMRELLFGFGMLPRSSLSSLLGTSSNAASGARAKSSSRSLARPATKLSLPSRCSTVPVCPSACSEESCFSQCRSRPCQTGAIRWASRAMCAQS